MIEYNTAVCRYGNDKLHNVILLTRAFVAIIIIIIINVFYLFSFV